MRCRRSASLGLGPSRWVPLALASLACLTACGARGGEDTAPAASPGAGGASGGEAAGVPEGWPRVVVIGPGTGPALFASASADAAAFGYLSPGVRARIEGAPRNGRVEVRIAGAMPIRHAWVPVDRVALYAQQRGRIEGTPYYVGPNDLVTVLGPEGSDRLRISVRPWLGGSTFLEASEGTLAASQLSDRPVDLAQVEGLSAGECFELPRGQEVAVFDRPSGRRVLSLPAQTPPLSVTVLRERSPWLGIRAGHGPYVVGYVQGPLSRCAGSPTPPAPMVPASANGVPHWMSDERGTLHRVVSGTTVVFGGQTVARLGQDGWARELGREPNDMVDAFVAVDGEAALRGLVPASALRPAR